MPFDGSLPDEVAPGEATAFRCKFLSPFSARRCNLVYDHGGSHEFGLTSPEPPGSANSSPDERCGRCPHTREEHGRLCCIACGDADLRASASTHDCHAFAPVEPEAPTAAQEAAVDELINLRQEMEADEPEAPECKSPQGCDKVVPCDPGCAVTSRLLREKLAQAAQPPRRPPYAVAYAIEGGVQYEIALPGDATIRAHEGALIITHASAVLALTQARPMEGA